MVSLQHLAAVFVPALTKAVCLYGPYHTAVPQGGKELPPVAQRFSPALATCECRPWRRASALRSRTRVICVSPGEASRATSPRCRVEKRVLRLGADLGWNVVGMDLSWPMLCAAANRTHEHGLAGRLHVVLAPMDRIPARDRTFDLIVSFVAQSVQRVMPERLLDVSQ
jgi:hypothetical protein